MATPKEVSLKIESIRYELEGDVMDAVSFLQKKHTELTRQGFTKLRIDIDTESDYGDSSDACAYLYGTRMETQEEADLREQQETRQREWYERREREQFEALKKKFG